MSASCWTWTNKSRCPSKCSYCRPVCLSVVVAPEVRLAAASRPPHSRRRSWTGRKRCSAYCEGLTRVISAKAGRERYDRARRASSWCLSEWSTGPKPWPLRLGKGKSYSDEHIHAWSHSSANTRNPALFPSESTIARFLDKTAPELFVPFSFRECQTGGSKEAQQWWLGF